MDSATRFFVVWVGCLRPRLFLGAEGLLVYVKRQAPESACMEALILIDEYCSIEQHAV